MYLSNIFILYNDFKLWQIFKLVPRKFPSFYQRKEKFFYLSFLIFFFFLLFSFSFHFFFFLFFFLLFSFDPFLPTKFGPCLQAALAGLQTFSSPGCTYRTVSHTERLLIQSAVSYNKSAHKKKTGFDAGATRERTSIPRKNVGGQNTTIKEWTQDDKMMNEKKRGNNPEKQERNNPVGRRPICVKP